MQVLSRAYPFGLENRLRKNDRQVVTGRKRELEMYCRAILQLAARLGSPKTDLAVQRFLRRSGGGVHYRWAELPVLLEGIAVRAYHFNTRLASQLLHFSSGTCAFARTDDGGRNAIARLGVANHMGPGWTVATAQVASD